MTSDLQWLQHARELIAEAAARRSAATGGRLRTELLGLIDAIDLALSPLAMVDDHSRARAYVGRVLTELADTAERAAIWATHFRTLVSTEPPTDVRH